MNFKFLTFLEGIVLFFLIAVICPSKKALAQPGCLFTDRECNHWNPTIMNKGFCTDNSYQLVFEDDFDGDEIDHSKWWTYRHHEGIPMGRMAPGCSAKEWNDERNVIVNNGICTLRMERITETHTGMVDSEYNDGCLKFQEGDMYSVTTDFSTGMIQTKEAWHPSEHIKVVASIKIPSANGVNSAFWFWNLSEIDVFETFDQPNASKLQANFHSHGQTFNCPCKYDVSPSASDNFLTYEMEINPLYLNWWYNDELVRSLHRYYNVLKQPIDICSPLTSQLQYVLEPDGYPALDSEWFFPIFGLGPQEVNSNSVQTPAEMYIDWVKIYIKEDRNDLCQMDDQQGNVVIESGTTEVWDSDDAFENSFVIVEDGATLEIRNCEIEFGEHTGIKLKSNATLLLDGATLTACASSDEWVGIVASYTESAQIIGSGSRNYIKKARTGINAYKALFSTINIPNTYIESGEYGLYLSSMDATNVSLIDGKFQDCDNGILLRSTENLELNDVVFNNCHYGIVAMNSFLHLKNNNRFWNGEHGIKIEGTHPSASGIIIGDLGTSSNKFIGQSNYAINATGVTGLEGLRIRNCLFEDIGEYAVGLDGANSYTLMNNSFKNCSSGLVASSNGGSLNFSTCNYFNNVSNTSISYIGDNMFSSFMENEFTGTSKADAGVFAATISSDIGSSIQAATNCFESSGYDIYTLSSYLPPYTGSSFNYHYFDDSGSSNCQKPVTSGNYFPILALNPSTDCDDIGNNGGIVQGGGQVLFGSSGSTGSGSCVTCVLDSIALYHNLYQNSNVLNRSNDSITTWEYLNIKSTLYFWVHEGINLALQMDSFDLAYQIINPLTDWYWQKELLGLKMLEGDFSGAGLLLASLPQNTTDQMYFNKVQELNLRWLQFDPNTDSITTEEIDELRAIALSFEPSSGFAKSLLKTLTGEIIPLEVPDWPTVIQPRHSMADSSSNIRVISIYPNPTNQNNVNITSNSTYIEKISVFDRYGKLLIEESEVNNKSEVLDMKNLVEGLYFVKIETENNQTVIKKLIKN